MLYDPKWEAKTETAMVLLHAAELVRERGLAKHRQVEEDGSVCLHGAISIAAAGKPWTSASSNSLHCKAALAVHKYLRSQGVDSLYSTPTGSAFWNNQYERTANEVIAALEGAAAMASIVD